MTTLDKAEVGESYYITKMNVPPPDHSVTNYSAIKVVSKDEKTVVFHCAGRRWSVNMNVASKIWLQKI
jgi:hypothetical protein